MNDVSFCDGFLCFKLTEPNSRVSAHFYDRKGNFNLSVKSLEGFYFSVEYQRVKKNNNKTSRQFTQS